MGEINPPIETFAKIKVVGVGGSGGSAVNRMIASKIRGVEFIVVNTDVQALHHSQAPVKLHIGKTVTRGLGAGMDPEVGARAADESEEEIREALKNSDMVFVTCGLGGGTGSGAGPKVAAIAKELGALTVAVVTKPFMFEGAQRKVIADDAHEILSDNVDTMITIPNDRILQIIDRKTSLLDAFEIADDVLRQGVQGISELITVPGLINVDFADVRAIMSNKGSALMGIGRGHGDNRASDAAKAAIASPLLEVSIDGAKGILFTITGGSNLGMYEVSEAAKVITQSADTGAKVIFGAIIDETMKDEVKVTVIATGFESRSERPKVKSVLSSGTYVPPRPPEALERMPFASSRPTSGTLRHPEPVAARPETVVQPVDHQSEPAPRPVTTPPAPVQPQVQAPSYAPIQNVRPAASPLPRVSPKVNDDEEDLEIPAFIRKKMM
ncbi:cell division protein FtsZ [Patescibacteria group bacterium]|nr:cell division protein FtsZ [Patescibacteria group bacterium]MBU1448318.1 cell division protein FtsZ [Patescibacteria group bacterium]MBU2612976.1 cell division protein FtsZ [Patescibacteria group bacterium]